MNKNILALVIIIAVVLAIVIAHPQTSPFAEIRDSDGDGRVDASDAFPHNSTETDDRDGDGWGDNFDVFPDDSTEWLDSDNDTVGDNADYYDEGKGSLYVRVIRFAVRPGVICDPGEGSSEPCDFKFFIGIDYEGTSANECVYDPNVHWGNANVVEEPQDIFLKCIVPDATPTIDVTIYVLDADEMTPGGIRIYEETDYTPDNELGRGYYTITAFSPFTETYSYVGNGNSGHPSEINWLIEVGPE